MNADSPLIFLDCHSSTLLKPCLLGKVRLPEHVISVSSQPPAMTKPPFLADARFVLNEQANPLGRMGRADFLQPAAEPFR